MHTPFNYFRPKHFRNLFFVSIACIAFMIFNYSIFSRRVGCSYLSENSLSFREFFKLHWCKFTSSINPYTHDAYADFFFNTIIWISYCCLRMVWWDHKRQHEWAGVVLKPFKQFFGIDSLCCLPMRHVLQILLWNSSGGSPVTIFLHASVFNSL